MINQHDQLTQRCKRLGSEVSFEYCRVHAEPNNVCGSIIQCWWERFDVFSFLNENLPEDQFKALHQPQYKPKVTRIMEIIEQAQRRISSDH
ncbi:hypothetical protein MHK_003009 [Candidatus Magnetomorum sp. HK-1]|nr:hypothetical protein MHK_003009 [Candidatus Magnetomorum sp. HK-1]